MIELKNISKTFQEGETTHIVLQDVNQTINENEIIILLGRSGSGKSTLLNLISGIDLPTSGDLLINHKNLTQFTEHDRTIFRRNHIGFVFQFFNLISTLSVLENLLLPLQLKGKSTQQDKNYALELLEEVGLGNRKDSFPDRLSGGEQQRVAIARAIVHDPVIVLADEPTGNLDYETGQNIISLLDKLVRSRQKTMLIATHSRELANLASRVLTIKEGKLHEVSSI
jgi:putative ABC transport system ATP-binding protein